MLLCPGRGTGLPLDRERELVDSGFPGRWPAVDKGSDLCLAYKVTCWHCCYLCGFKGHGDGIPKTTDCSSVDLLSVLSTRVRHQALSPSLLPRTHGTCICYVPK